MAALRVPILLWMRLILQLRRRGASVRESGAFLLGPTFPHVTTFVCYDDLDPESYQSGGISFHAEGYAALWQQCREKNLQLLADVHTHPGRWVRQSPIDQRNPMVPVVGHTAIILPHFARMSPYSLKGVGVYEYLGNFKWRTHDVAQCPRRIVLTPW